jgi:hypothetical protein
VKRNDAAGSAIAAGMGQIAPFAFGREAIKKQQVESQPMESKP